MIYAVRKAGTFVITLVLVSILTFGVFQILPGDPVDIILGVEADPMQAAALTKELGLDKPIMERYFDWVFGAVRGDLGNSIRYQVPVGDLLKSSLPVTASLAVLSILLTILISVPAAVFLAKNHRKNSAMVLSSVTQFGIAVPSFWIGILLIMLFAVQFHILPSGDYTPFSENPIEWLKSLILPACSIAVGTTATIIRYLKNTILDQMGFDYVRTARSKGMTQKQVLFKHVLKNALLPAITILGMMIVDVLGGSVIVENVFNLPGIGHLLTSGVGNRDFPLVQGLVFYLAITVLVINLLVDFLYTVVDPRIRVGGLEKI